MDERALATQNAVSHSLTLIVRDQPPACLCLLISFPLRFDVGRWGSARKLAAVHRTLAQVLHAARKRSHGANVLGNFSPPAR
jgi:hypothetical protein